MSASDGPDANVLVVDTSTRSSIVVLGGQASAAPPLATSRRDVRHRHGSHVLEQIDEVLGTAAAPIDSVSGLAVGTGPGSFTGLRVGLATAKTIAYARGLPIVGVASSDALRHAAVAAGAPADIVVVLPAGAHDHYLARAGQVPLLVPPGELEAALSGSAALTVDLPSDVAGDEAARMGETALAGLPQALLALARERLASGSTDDVAELSPVYVALPRGVDRDAEGLGWSPDLR